MKRKTLFTALSVVIAGTWLVLTTVHFTRTKDPDRGFTPAGLSASTVTGPQREWMDIFLEDDKVGYSSNSLTPVDEGYVVMDEIFLRLNLMGQVNEVRTVTMAVLDTDFLLKRFRFTMQSGAVTFNASGSFDGNVLEVETGEGAAKSVHRIPLDSRPMIGAGIGHFFKGREIQVGDSFNFPIFDPSTMTRASVKTIVAAEESVEIKGISYDGYRLDADFLGRTLHFWIDRQGAVLRQEGLMGLNMVRSSAASAPFGLDAAGGLDYYDIAAVSPTGRIKDPLRIRSLKVGLSGVEFFEPDEDRQFHWNCDRQTLDPERGVLKIRSETMPSVFPYRLPYGNRGPEMGPYLAPGPGIESDHQSIVSTADKVVGDTSDPGTAAVRLLDWVYRNVEKRPVLSIPSALDVLRTMQGDCNEHAVLLSALLRAAGIPSRIVVGLVYTRGKFYYHAWNEAYFGRWVSMDATLNQIPAGATHISLIRGGPEEQTAIIRLIGKLEIEILEYGY